MSLESYFWGSSRYARVGSLVVCLPKDSAVVERRLQGTEEGRHEGVSGAQRRVGGGVGVKVGVSEEWPGVESGRVRTEPRWCDRILGDEDSEGCDRGEQ